MIQSELKEFQRVALPSIETSIPNELYYKVEEPTAVKIEEVHGEKRLLLTQLGVPVEFNSFYNSLSVNTWRVNCQLEDVALSIKGSGQVIVVLNHIAIGSSQKMLVKREIELDKDAASIIEVPHWKEFESGLVFVTLIPVTASTIDYANWVTSTPIRRSVKLGVVITHFNRKKIVIPAVKRLDRELLSDPAYSDISLCVVDNSQNISPEEISRTCILLPNPNTGGTGGFTRGLLQFKKASFTHCIFMDDDARCDVESIRRVFHFYQFLLSDSKLAIAGAMIQESKPLYSYEVGAFYTYHGCKRNKEGLYLLEAEDLIRFENAPHGSYGAWCFFAFPIASVEKYSLPLFVRGDDVLFSFVNKFKIRSIVGVACFIDSFALKDSPLTRYHAFRGNLFDKIMIHTGIGILNISLFFATQFVASLFSYKYESAEVIFMALEDTLKKGISTLTEDKTETNLRNRIEKINKVQKLSPVEVPFVELPRKMEENIFRKLFRGLTFNGSLTPFLMSDRTVLQSVSPKATFRQIFLFRKVYYYNNIDKVGYVCSFSLYKFWAGLITLTKGLFLILCKFHETKKNIRSEAGSLLTEEFWSNYLDIPPSKG